ncbi:MAG: serine/threonine-protein kinase [Planctomycetota bacterium]
MSGVKVYNSGDTIGAFKVLAELGRGAASIIYLVQDPKTKQVWALKHVQKLTEKDQRFLEQAEQEYKVSGKLDHAAFRKIPKLLKEGNFLSVKGLMLQMELVDGVSCDTKPPKTFESAVHIFLQVARGLAHMHGAGFVHADMKPNNVVVDDDGLVKVIDLGQSCKIGTVKPRIQGTPDYIAPEQVHRRPITGATDIYNLGATMYWTLTRQHIPTALAKEDSLVGSLDDSLIEKPKPVRELNTKCPERLSDLIMHCVEVDPADRPETMSSVADQLELIQGVLRARSGGDGAEG